MEAHARRGSLESLPLPDAVPHGIVRCRGSQTCRAIGGYGRATRCTGPDDFAPFASQVAWRTERTQAALGGRSVGGLGQRPLAGCLARAIDVKDQPLHARAIPQTAGMLRFAQRTTQQIREKARTQRFDSILIECGEPARERRARGQAITSEERHEHAGPGPHPLVEGFERPFAAEGIPEEDGKEIDDLVVPEAAADKADVLAESREDPLLLKAVDEQRHFPKSGGWCGGRVRGDLEMDGRRRNASHTTSAKPSSRPEPCTVQIPKSEPEPTSDHATRSVSCSATPCLSSCFPLCFSSSVVSIGSALDGRPMRILARAFAGQLGTTSTGVEKL